MTARDLLSEASQRVERLDARLLVAEVTRIAPDQIDRRQQADLSWPELQQARRLIRRRAEDWPLAYLRRRQEFWDMELTVDRRVLCPRPESELILELSHELRLEDGSWAIDVGTGSGALAIGLGRLHPSWQVAGSDCSAGALTVARMNGRRWAPAVHWWWGDLLAPVRQRRIRPRLVVANLPYVAPGDRIDAAVRHEPAVAVWGGPDGLSPIRRLIAEASGLLPPGGRLMLEVGAGQADRVLNYGRGLFAGEATIHKDLSGQPRVVVFCRGG